VEPRVHLILVLEELSRVGGSAAFRAERLCLSVSVLIAKATPNVSGIASKKPETLVGKPLAFHTEGGEAAAALLFVFSAD